MKITCENCGCVMVGNKSIESEHRSAALDLALEIGDSPNTSAPMRCPKCDEPPNKIYYACVDCGSTAVMVQEWIDPNTEKVCPIPEITAIQTTEYEHPEGMTIDEQCDSILDEGDEVLVEAGWCLSGITHGETKGLGNPSPFCSSNDPEPVGIVALGKNALFTHQAKCRKKYEEIEAEIQAHWDGGYDE